jgi:large subunit ribosomal protein L31e
MVESKEIKRTYNIPLRSGFLKKPKHTRAKVAIRIIKDFLKKHMKSDDIYLGKKLNELIWENGMKNPPHHVKVDVVKDSDNAVTAELFGHKYVSNKKQEKKESFKDRLMEKVAGPEKTVVKKVKESDDKNKDSVNAETKKQTKEIKKKDDAVKKTKDNTNKKDSAAVSKEKDSKENKK